MIKRRNHNTEPITIYPIAFRNLVLDMAEEHNLRTIEDLHEALELLAEAGFPQDATLRDVKACLLDVFKVSHINTPHTE